MQLLIKQRVFSWTDTYDVYDQNGEAKYFVKAEFFTLGHKLHVYDMHNREVGVIREKLFSLLPVFEIDVDGECIGKIEKRFTLFYSKYDIDYMNWRAEGDFLDWEYDVYEGCSSVVHVTKKWLSWGDTYVIDFADPSNEIAALMLVLSIDAANCTERS